MPTFWDIALIAAVSLMGTTVAYVRNPEHKAFVLMLPIPFTLATLALGRPIDATNVLAMGVLFGFTIAVWALHARMGWPMLIAIPVSALGYCAVGAGLNRLIPAFDAVFWLSAVAVFAAPGC